MRKTNLMKACLVLVVSVVVALFSTNVFAAENVNGFNDLTGTLNNTNSNNVNTNSNTNNTNTNTNKVNNTNTNNTSIYNNTNLPKTGIEDSIPVALLVVVFGVSAVYAYKKIKEYRNI